MAALPEDRLFDSWYVGAVNLVRAGRDGRIYEDEGASLELGQRISSSFGEVEDGVPVSLFYWEAISVELDLA